jgi:hypothetical protein
MFSVGCTMNIGSKKLQREAGLTFCGAQPNAMSLPFKTLGSVLQKQHSVPNRTLCCAPPIFASARDF